MCCRMFSSIHGFYPLGAHHCENHECLQMFSNVTEEAKLFQLRITIPRQITRSRIADLCTFRFTL